VLIKELRILWPFCPLSTARTNDRMIGPPRSMEVALVCGDFGGERSGFRRGVLSGQCSPTLKGRPGDSEALGARAHGDFPDGVKLRKGRRLQGTSKALPLRSSPCEARDGALLQSVAFELAQGGENCELEPSAGGPEVFVG
jgi:hypothetical protein